MLHNAHSSQSESFQQVQLDFLVDSRENCERSIQGSLLSPAEPTKSLDKHDPQVCGVLAHGRRLIAEQDTGGAPVQLMLFKAEFTADIVCIIELTLLPAAASC